MIIHAAVTEYAFQMLNINDILSNKQRYVSSSSEIHLTSCITAFTCIAILKDLDQYTDKIFDLLLFSCVWGFFNPTDPFVYLLIQVHIFISIWVIM